MLWATCMGVTVSGFNTETWYASVSGYRGQRAFNFELGGDGQSVGICALQNRLKLMEHVCWS